MHPCPSSSFILDHPESRPVELYCMLWKSWGWVRNGPSVLLPPSLTSISGSLPLLHPSMSRCPCPRSTVKVQVQVAQLCLILCDPMDFTVHGILQARILEWGAFPFSRDLSNLGIKPRSPSLQVDSLTAEPPGKPTKPINGINGWDRNYFSSTSKGH